MAAPDRPHLESNAMSVADIVFFVLAAVAPVGVIVSLLIRHPAASNVDAAAHTVAEIV